jgi:peptide/nickel transport system substrate-binding protein
MTLAVALASCGGGDPVAEDEEPVDPRRGGEVTQLSSGDVDTLDPGATYQPLGFQVAAATHRTLYTYRPGKVGELVPDLADGPPEVSDDARTVTVRLREGVRFAPPVGREVVAGDVRYAIERSLSANVGRPYAYFTAIRGVVARPGPVRRVAGISTPDTRTLVFRLRGPVGPQFAAALVLPATAPVPPEYAREHDGRVPSTYGAHVIATGPYRVASAPNGRVRGVVPGERIRLVRNPAWDRGTDERAAHLDRIVIRTDATDVEAAVRRVVRGEGLVLGPPAPPQSARGLPDGRHAIVSSGGFRYLPLNTAVAPFDDLDVRRAVLAAFDREGALAAAGGDAVGEVASHFLPPDVPGFEEAGGRGSPHGFLRAPGGDRRLAARYLRAAGYASGRYEGDEQVVIAGPNVSPGREQAEFARDQLERLGFRVRLRLVPEDAFYSDVCATPSNRIDMCAGVGWFRDFSDPQSMLEPRFRGTAPTNLSQLRAPAVDRAMAAATPLTGRGRREAWGAIDARVAGLAAAVPLRWEHHAVVWGRDVEGVVDPFTALLDLAEISRRRG